MYPTCTHEKTQDVRSPEFMDPSAHHFFLRPPVINAYKFLNKRRGVGGPATRCSVGEVWWGHGAPTSPVPPSPPPPHHTHHLPPHHQPTHKMSFFGKKGGLSAKDEARNRREVKCTRHNFLWVLVRIFQLSILCGIVISSNLLRRQSPLQRLDPKEVFRKKI